MTSATAVEYFRPRDWQEFERLSRALFSEIYGRPFKRWGRSGQRQYGIDLFAQLKNGKVLAVQCKGRSAYLGHTLSTKDIDAAVAAADTCPQPLELLIIVTTASDDRAFEEHVLTLNRQRESTGKFPVLVWGWETMCDHIGEHQKVQRRYYGAWFQRFSIWHWFICAVGVSLVSVFSYLGTIHILNAWQIKTLRNEASIRELQGFVHQADELIDAYGNCEKQLAAQEFAFSGGLKHWCIDPVEARITSIEQQIQRVAPLMDTDAWAEINALTALMREDYRQGLIAVEMTNFFEDRMVRDFLNLCYSGKAGQSEAFGEVGERESNRDAVINQLHFFFVVRDFVLPGLKAMKARALVHARRVADEPVPNDLVVQANRLTGLLQERQAYSFKAPRYPLTISKIKARASRNIAISGDSEDIENLRWQQVRLAAFTKSFFGRSKEIEQLISCGVFKPEARALASEL